MRQLEIIGSTQCDCNMVSHDLKFVNHDTNSEITSHKNCLLISTSLFITLKYFNKIK